MNQKGVTLIELLVTVLIMTFVLSVSINLVNVAVTSEREVSVNNQLQREARFIIEQVTEKMRDGYTASYDDVSKTVVFSDGSVLSLDSGVFINRLKISQRTTTVYDIHLVLIHSYKNIDYELNTEIVIADRFRY